MSHRDCQRGYLCPITIEPGRQTFKWRVFTWWSCKFDRHSWNRFTLCCCSKAANVAGLGLSLQMCELKYDMRLKTEPKWKWVQLQLLLCINSVKGYVLWFQSWIMLSWVPHVKFCNFLLSVLSALVSQYFRNLLLLGHSSVLFFLLIAQTRSLKEAETCASS